MVKIIAGSHDFGLIAANYMPPAPAAGYGKLYQRVDGNFYKMNVTGPELQMMDGSCWPKPNCKAATTVNITLSGAQTIDGVACAAGDRVLVKNQGTNSQNGIYVVQTGTWTRAPDASTAPFLAGSMVSVDQGSTNAGRQFRTYFKATDTVGTTGLDWWYVIDSLSGSILYASATPGAGLAVTGNTLSIGVGGVDSNMIANGSITDTDVAAANKDGAVGTASMRTLGTGAQQAMPGNKTFTKTDVGLANVDNTSDVNKPVSTAQQTAINALVPSGCIQMYGGTTGAAPAGWLVCDGSAVSRTTYAALFAVIGTVFGAGDGSTTFNVPDMQHRFPVGGSSTLNVGHTDGIAAEASRTPGHSHDIAVSGNATSAGGSTQNRITAVAGITGANGTGQSGVNLGLGVAQTTTMPHTTLGFIIKT